MPKIVSTDQNGFIKGRNISYNIRLIQDIIDYAEKFEVNGAVLFLDFAKAFDTVEWNYMFATLKHFGFKSSFIKWVKTLYANITCKISNNGWLSESLNISRGIRQGCPLSALLFVITVETMAARLRQEESLHGLKFHNTQSREYKISQLADDTTLFLKAKSDITKALNIIETFGSLSGLILNREKSQGIKLGDKGIIEDNFEQIDWTSSSVKALGVHFGVHSENILRLNWEIGKIEKLINKWRNRKLTMIGRIQITKSILIPQITYIISVLPMPNDTIKRIEQLLYKFVWDNKPEKIKRKTMIKTYEDGGLKMIDLYSHVKTIQSKWVLKLLENDHSGDQQWKILPQFYYNKFGADLFIFNLNLDNLKNLPNYDSIPLFYQEVLKAWNDIGGGQKEYSIKPTDIASQYIWGNKFIKYKKKMLLFKNWINSDIRTIKDLLDEQGKISEEVILRKLTDKHNWMSQITIIKKAIPEIWLQLLKNSDIHKYNFHYKQNIRMNSGKKIPLNKLTNRMIYSNLVQKRPEDPITFNYWKYTFGIEKIALNKTLTFIFHGLEENKYKIFRWKLLNKILPTKLYLYKWKITRGPKGHISCT